MMPLLRHVGGAIAGIKLSITWKWFSFDILFFPLSFFSSGWFFFFKNKKISRFHLDNFQNKKKFTLGPSRKLQQCESVKGEEFTSCSRE
jgi:hypothetical protein